VAESIAELTDFLKKKQENPNARTIPAIILGPEIPKDRVRDLAQFGVVKYFHKPIRFDIFFDSVGKILKTSFLIDTTPSVFDVHLNKDIIFVEIARGLNRDKISLLRFKISEIIDANDLINPKAIVTMAEFEPSFIDGANLELLFNNLVADHRLPRKNIKVLSLNDFTKQLIKGHPQYRGIEVVSSISSVISALAGDGASDGALADGRLPSGSAHSRSAQICYQSETSDIDDYMFEGVKVAIVDDEPEAILPIETAFKKAKADVSLYTDAQFFLADAFSAAFDVVILDIMMPHVTGLDVLKLLAQKKYPGNVLVYSKVTQREVVLQAMQLGARGYMIKPQTPASVLKKTYETMYTLL
jgi:DNA-binding NarL/FixJ family response regulator